MSDLRQFTGSETWHRHGLIRSILFTDGAKHVADAGGAYWLLDTIALAQKHCPNLAVEEFQRWTLRVAADHTATIRCEDGNGRELFNESLPFTDFPMPEITLWFTDNVILLPSEY
jgi:hypothetical protein